MTKHIAPTYSEATEQFIAASDWIGPIHAPAVTSLRLIAAQLDQELTAALAAQYGLTYRNLLKSQPTAVTDDPLERALKGVEQ